MTKQHEFYTERAEDARRDADTASLANVRDRCLRAAAAWDAMAARAARSEQGRAQTEARKAAAAVVEAEASSLA